MSITTEQSGEGSFSASELRNISDAVKRHRGDELLDTESVTEQYPFPKATLYGWRYHRTGPPSVRLGRRVYYRRRDIEKWIDEQAAKQARR
jgi:predicted DNA-binding transcriptional regulator AlpA